MHRCYRPPWMLGLQKVQRPSFSNVPCIGQIPAIPCRHYHGDLATSAVSAAPEVLAPPKGTPQTYLDYMEHIWNRKWFGTVDGSAAETAGTHVSSADPSLFTQMFLSCQQALSMEAGTLLFLAGALTRLCTLFLSLYGERAGERMRLALPELKKPQEDFNRVYFNDLASAMEVQVAASVLKSHRRAVFRKYRTSNLRCIASIGMAPVIMAGIYQVSALCDNVSLDVGTSSYLWCTALTLPDPFLVLPTLTCLITLLNFELSFSKEVKTGWMRNLIWGARLGCLCVIPVVTSFRSGVCLYLLGMNAVGLLQPLLLRSTFVRKWLGFPSREQIAAATPHRSVTAPRTLASSRTVTLRERIVAAVAPAENPTAAGVSIKAGDAAADVLKASMTVQFPYLSHLLNPQADEHQDLFAKAPNKHSKPNFSDRARGTSSSGRYQGQQVTAFAQSGAAPAHGSRYARGVNPLMQETPLHRQTPSSSNVMAHESGRAGGSSDAPAPAVETSGAIAAAAAKWSPRRKGSTFASTGWKSTQLSFSEADFIPTYPNGIPSNSSSSSSQSHK